MELDNNVESSTFSTFPIECDCWVIINCKAQKNNLFSNHYLFFKWFSATYNKRINLFGNPER